MSKIELVNTVTRSFHKVGFKLKKHSPEIMVVAGVVGFVTSAVMACKATTKLNPIIEDTKKEVGNIHEHVEKHGFTEEYTEKDYKKELVATYAHTGVEIGKLYGPSVAIGAASIACVLAGHNITRKRSAYLAAAYATLDNGFKEYRGRVIERFGQELDKELKYNIRTKEVEDTVVGEDGTETVIKKTINVASIDEYSQYARIYDDGCLGWTKDPEFNMMYLRRVEAQLTDKLKSQGYLFLNDAYEALGFPKTKQGFRAGWLYNEKEPTGDNYVDFGLYQCFGESSAAERRRAFINGYERVVIIDPNVDGDILEMM